MDEDNFTLEVHHGGVLIQAPNNIQYVGGDVHLVFKVDRDRMSIIDLQGVVLETGEPTVGNIHYLVPTGNLQLGQGLRLAATDFDVLYMFDIFKKCGVFTIPLYCEAGPQPGNVVIDREQLLPVDEVGVEGKERTNQGVGVNIAGENDVVHDFSTHAPPFVPYGQDNIQFFDDYSDVYMEGMHEDVGNLSNDSLPEWAKYDGEVFADIFDSTAESQKCQMDQQDYRLVEEENSEPDDVDDGREITQEDWDEQPLPDRELRDLQGSDDEGENVAEFNETTDMNAPHLEVGMLFANSTVFREALTQYCVKHAVDFKWTVNLRRKVGARCVNYCGWKIYAAAKQGENEMQIKSFYPNCDCGRTFKNCHVTAKFISKRYFSAFVDNPKWEVGSIKNTVRSDICVDVTKQKSYRAKRMARALIEGDENMQFARLRDYAHMIMKTNPGNQVFIYCDDDGRFQRIYVRYHAQKVGFLAGCRPIIGLDGTFLKGSFGGQMLAAIARDGNENCFCWVHRP